jgi:VWFA-related protein
MLPPRIAFAFGLIALAAAHASVSARGWQQQQPPPPQQAPTFRTRVSIVQLDVTVLDKDRRPVRGLRQADFTILEDGKPRPIAGFTSFDIDDTPAPATGWMRDIPRDVVTNDRSERRLFVLVLDDAMIPQRAEFIRDSKKIAESIIERFGPDDLAAVVFTGDNRQTQDFTSDKTKLRAAIDGFNPGLADYRFGIDGGVDVDMHFYMSAVKTLSNIAEYLIAVPDKRKAIFWISPGVPYDIEAAAVRRAPRAGEGGPPMSGTLDMRDLAERTEEIFRRAQLANVVIYPLDPTGLGGMRNFINQRLPPSDIRVQQVFDSENKRQLFVMTKTAALTDFLAQAASSTGGRVVMNTSDWEPGISEIFGENKSYYLIGFEPASAAEDGKLHRIEVKVNRPGVDVRSRSSYYAPETERATDPKKPAASPETVALGKAIGGVLAESGLPMKVTLAPFAVPGQRLATVAVTLGIRQPIAAKTNERITETTELLISAFTPEGTARGTQRHTARVVIRAGADGEAAYEVLGRIDLPPGRYSLRMAAHMATLKKSGSVFADVVVPDYSNTPVSAAPVVLSASPGRASAPRALLVPLLPFVPTADREFTKAQKVAALLRLYQSGQKGIERAVVTITLRDAGDAVLVKEARTIDAREFVALGQALIAPETQVLTKPGAGVGPPRGRGLPATPTQDQFANLSLAASDIRYALPIDRLQPGEYLLTFEVLVGAPASASANVLRRDVRFSVK